MNTLGKLLVTESKVLSRDWGILTFGVLFPAALLLALARVFPGFLDADPELGGARLVDLFAPIAIVFLFAMVGVSSISSYLATYRTRGILRRLRTTPVGPARLLAAQLTAHLLFGLVGVALAMVTALTLLEVPAPQHWGWLLLTILLAGAALFAIGSLIGSLSPSTSASQAIGTFVWLPLMVLGGLWLPREAMPDGMRRISDLSPTGAGVDAVQQSWFGSGPTTSSLVVLVASTLVVGLVAAATFRWE